MGGGWDLRRGETLAMTDLGLGEIPPFRGEGIISCRQTHLMGTSMTAAYDRTFPNEELRASFSKVNEVSTLGHSFGDAARFRAFSRRGFR